MPEQPAQLALPVENDDGPLIAKLQETLADRQWNFHTIAGLARSANVDRAAVVRVLDENPKLVRYVPLTKDGQQLFVDGSRPLRGRPLLLTLRAYFAKTIIEVG